MGLSAKAIHRLLKIARTIANLELFDSIRSKSFYNPSNTAFSTKSIFKCSREVSITICYILLSSLGGLSFYHFLYSF
ncbi:hypothetical protein [Calditerrivibrio nitroreducens]|uniref:hypothetical protein n=1 Tax=Calditerrivibrio nitroreducens TaxID=477976 RepID=UPI000A06935A